MVLVLAYQLRLVVAPVAGELIVPPEPHPAPLLLAVIIAVLVGALALKLLARPATIVRLIAAPTATPVPPALIARPAAVLTRLALMAPIVRLEQVLVLLVTPLPQECVIAEQEILVVQLRKQLVAL
jgi:hypothetical protein